MKQLSEVHSRFLDAPWYGERKEIIVGGAGGIGSWLGLFLARTGHAVHFFDFDSVEIHNMGGQFFQKSDIGRNKAAIAVEYANFFAANAHCTANMTYDLSSPSNNIIFSCFDNMEARKVMFLKWQEFRKANPEEGPFIFIDGRLEAETAYFYCVTDDASADKWLEEWFPDSTLPDAACTFKATTHCAAILAGLMNAAFNNWVAGKGRSVPFKTMIFLPSMMVETKETP